MQRDAIMSGVHSKGLTLGIWLLMVLLLLLGTLTVAMTNDEPLVVQQEQFTEQQPQATSESPYISKIPAKPKADENVADLQRHEFHTVIQELKAAGVRTTGNKELETLTYGELMQLLAMWHLTHQRNYYAPVPKAQTTEP